MSRESHKRRRRPQVISTLDILDKSTPELTEDPFAVLGVSRTADAATIRRAYLSLVRDHPPEQSPDMFMRIRQAYEWLETPDRRAAALVMTPNAPEGTDLTVDVPKDGPQVAGIPLAFLLARDPFSDLVAPSSGDGERNERPDHTGSGKC